MKVVAEGVETAAQQETMAQLGCNFLQGYLFSKPLPAELIETQLHSARRKKRQPGKQH
jgi:EAL domain-containing protein (putative c-di-GMP-specific phosphodiesterase class I)